MRSSRLKPCPICGKQVRSRGYPGHLAMAHGVARPNCYKCGARGTLVFWSERNKKFVFRCPRGYQYLGPATFDAAMLLPMIEGDYEDLRELRRKWGRE